jgi:heme A synthase
MKTKYLLIAQIMLLLGVLTAGFLLKGNLADGPRDAHKVLGLLSGVVGAVSAILLVKNSKEARVKLTSVLSVIFSFVAGVFGRGLKSTSSYDKMFNAMRISGVLALLAASAALYWYIGSSSKNTKK